MGVPEAQAEAQAELMAEAFVFNMDALVTKDYLEQCLDARFAAQDARLMVKIDARFDAQDKRIDARFDAQDKRFDARFEAQHTKFEDRFALQDKRFAEQDHRFDTQDGRFERIEAHLNNHALQFEEIRGELKLHRWILALIAASTVIPALQKLFAVLVN